MKLSKKILPLVTNSREDFPAGSNFELPEKVLQFGTGVLLRGLPDYFINKANRQQIFNGRIVVVKSTAQGATDAFHEQDGMYTILEKGIVNGIDVNKKILNASISRVLSANDQWAEILNCSVSPALQVVISNTTEVGISLLESDATADIPLSFPGRLLQILWKRYLHFNGATDKGLVIIPTELIVNNGSRLKEIILQLARIKGSPELFIDWLNEANDFCNSLVDCIVPGKLSSEEQKAVEKELGYEDALMIMSEPYRLWAIETDKPSTKKILSFAKVDESVILTGNIEKYREIKLRLLNATHTFSSGLAVLAGFKTVKEAMRDRLFEGYLQQLMIGEIVPLVTGNTITKSEAMQFAAQVIDRFKNPYIEHQWLAITAQYTSKIQMRTVPLLQKHFQIFSGVPLNMALGIAAFIRFMQPDKNSANKHGGKYREIHYPIQDDKAGLLAEKWLGGEIANCLQDSRIFGADLSVFPGLEASVNEFLQVLEEDSPLEAIRSILAKKTVA